MGQMLQLPKTPAILSGEIGEVPVHLLPGVTGKGTAISPFTGFDAIIAAAGPHSSFLFRDDHYATATGILVTSNDITLHTTGGTIIRSTQAAYPTRNATGALTWVAGTDTWGNGNLVTVPLTAHGFAAGDVVVIGGGNQSEYRGLFTVYAPTTDTFKVYIKLREQPVTPSTGTYTVKKARYMLKVSKPFTNAFATEICWKPAIKGGFIFDGQGSIELGFYARNWLGGIMSEVEYRDIVEQVGRGSLNVGSTFSQVKSVYTGAGPFNSVAVKSMFHLGEMDANPSLTLDVPVQGGAYNVVFDTCYLYGTTGTLLHVPSGFGLQVLNGNAGGAATCLDFGPYTSQFIVRGADLESGGNLYLDGYQHSIENVNALAVTVNILNHGNAAGKRGKHYLNKLDNLTGVLNNCDVESTIIDFTGTVTGTHPEMMAKYTDGLRKLSVDGGNAVREQWAGVTKSAVVRNVSVGARDSGTVVTPSATYYYDGFTPADYTEGTMVASGAVRQVGSDLHIFGVLAAGNLAINGNGSRGATVVSNNGGLTYVSLFSAGVSGGFMAGSSAGSFAYFGYGLPDFNNDAAVLASTALVVDSANGVRFKHNVGFFDTAPVAKPTVVGSKGGNAALTSLTGALAALGLITDTTT